MLTPDTTNAFLIIENVDTNRSEEYMKATEQLAALIKKYLSQDVTCTYLSTSNREMEI